MDTSEDNAIYSDHVLFTTEIESVINCAELCTAKCSSFSYSYKPKECRGYGDRLLGRLHRNATFLWKRSCRAAKYTYDPAFGTCVRLFNIRKNWTMASDVCTYDGTHLLIADTIEKVQASQNGVHSSKFLRASRWWIGGYDYDEGSANNFKWVNGVSISVTSNIWYPTEPNDPSERCVNLLPSSGYLHDLNCSEEEFFVCQEH
ncbi:C-type lectin domain family 6 member A-like [Pecten maximus]|uniref:C-type lectin domain family 6 member A-like n=1 Tax=Pecten maximus TaxID=6579 RepID=UPI001458A225|nr:C-type lectin domain family 6 member A-like [Pecten maximus]